MFSLYIRSLPSHFLVYSHHYLEAIDLTWLKNCEKIQQGEYQGLELVHAQHTWSGSKPFNGYVFSKEVVINSVGKFGIQTTNRG